MKLIDTYINVARLCNMHVYQEGLRVCFNNYFVSEDHVDIQASGEASIITSLRCNIQSN